MSTGKKGSVWAAIVLGCLAGSEIRGQGPGPAMSGPGYNSSRLANEYSGPLGPPSTLPPPLPAGAHAADPSLAASENPAGGLPAEEDQSWWSGFFFDLNYLLLHPRRDYMDYAIVSPNSSGVPTGDILSRDWTWRSGLREGLGYRLPGGKWGVGLYYTYLHDNASASIAAPAGGVLFATLTHPGTVSQVETASADTSLNYNLFDLEVGRWWNAGDRLATRFFGGGRWAHIDQNMNALYNGIDANNDLVAQTQHFNGFGFLVGGEAFLNLCWGINLFARTDAALLSGQIHTTLLETNNAGATTLTNVNDHLEKIVPVASMTMGAGWRYGNLYLLAGYQFVNWFGLVQAPDFVDDVHQGKLTTRSGDLSLEGLVLRAEMRY
jgi:hypothetical protein